MSVPHVASPCRIGGMLTVAEQGLSQAQGKQVVTYLNEREINAETYAIEASLLYPALLANSSIRYDPLVPFLVVMRTE